MGQEQVTWSLGKPPDPEYTIGQATPEWSIGTPASTPPPVPPPQITPSPITTGPATPPMKGSGVEGGESAAPSGNWLMNIITGDWLTTALTGPSTHLGKLLRGTSYVGSIQEKEDLKHGIHPGPLNLQHPSEALTSPFIDIGAGVFGDKGAPRGVPSAIFNTLSSFTSPQQAPLMAAPGLRAISGLFAVTTIPQVMQQYERYQQAKAKGDSAGMQEAGTEMGITTILGALASYHAGSLSSEPIYLDKSDKAYITGMVQQHIENAAANGDHVGIHDGVEGFASILPSILKEERRGTEGVSPTGSERRSLENTPEGQAVIYKSMLEETIESDRRALLNKSLSPEERARIEDHKSDYEDLLEQHNESPTQQAKANIPLRKDRSTTGQVNPSSSEALQSAEAQGIGEEDIRNDSGAAGGAGRSETATGLSTEQEGDGGEGSQGQLDNKVAALSTLLPDFQKVIGGGEGVTGATEASSPAPVISSEIDRNLANGGIQVVRGGDDIGLVARYLGSLSQAANRLGNPIFKMVADRIVDTSLAIARNTRDSLMGFRKEVRGNITPAIWEQVVNLLDDPAVNKTNLPAGIDPKTRDAYNYTRDLLDRHRIQARDAKRLEMVAGGMSLTKAKTLVPDDWGIQEGYYVHAFPGNWTIMEHVGVDPHGNPLFEPIDTNWRATTISEAQAKAREYLAANPSANLKVQLDNVTLPGRGIADRNRLQALHDEIKDASMFIYNGANPDGVMAALRQTSDKLNFGPRRPAPKTYGPTLERESNLPGFVRDLDNFERYIQGMERYIQLAPARAEILKFRNALAKGTGVAELLKPGDMPKRYSGEHANMLGRLDASIEALEGYPTGFDAAIRNQLQKFGYDPNLLNSIYSHVNSIEALLKLGFNPASAGLHLAQTIIATYPVIGEKWTGYGIANAYSSKYDALVHDLGIEATTNLLDVDTYKAYRAGYSRSLTQTSGLGETLKGLAATGYHDLQATGLYMFSKGVETARRVAAIGAYEKALSEGLSQKEARDYSRDTLIRTQFLYNPVDTPIAMRMLPRSMTQFKNFTVKMAEFMYGLRGAEVPRFMLGMGALGYAGLPFLTLISSMVKGIFDYDPEAELKRFFPRASRGVLGMLGVDYTKNIGFSDWLGGHSLDPKNFGGPGVSDLTNVIKGIAGEIKGPSREGQNDIDSALRNISPEARRVWDEGLRMATSPKLIDPRTGSTIIDNLSPRERLELAAGLTPIRVAQERDTHEYIRNQIESTRDKRGWFVDRLAELALDLSHPDLSEEDRIETVKKVVSLSRSAQDYGVAYQLPKAVLERAKAMQLERLTRDVKKSPKINRLPAYKEMERFKEDNP